MFKKTMAVLLASAVATAGIIGLTGCDGLSDNGDNGNNGTISVQKGEKVTEQQWKSAISKTANAIEYVVTFDDDDITTASGKIGNETVNYTNTTTVRQKIYYDYKVGKTYGEVTTAYKTTGAKLFGGEDSEESVTIKDYNEIEKNVDGYTIWGAVLFEGANGWDVNANVWDVESKLCGTESEVLDEFSGGSPAYEAATSEFSKNKDGKEVGISELYSSFAYKNGVYSATLYSDGEEMEVTISFKDGYILSLGLEDSEEETEDGTLFKSVYKSVSTFSDYNQMRIPTAETASYIQDAVAAIEKEKTATAPGNNDIAGKTFVLKSLSFDDGTPEEEVDYGVCTIAFDNNGGFYLKDGSESDSGTYTQTDDAIVLVYDSEDYTRNCHLENGNFIMYDYDEDTIITLTFVLAD